MGIDVEEGGESEVSAVRRGREGGELGKDAHFRAEERRLGFQTRRRRRRRRRMRRRKKEDEEEERGGAGKGEGGAGKGKEAA